MTATDILTVHLLLKYFAEYVSEGDCSAVTPDSSIHTETLASQRTGSPSSAQPSSAPETPLASIQSSPVNYTQDFVSASQSHSRRSEVSVFHSLYASEAALMVAWSILRLTVVTCILERVMFAIVTKAVSDYSVIILWNY